MLLKSFWRKDEFRWWLLPVCALHFFPFITENYSAVMYVLIYGIPAVYLLANVKFLIKTAADVLSSRYCVVPLGLAFVGLMSLALPSIYCTGDLTYFTMAFMTMVKIALRMLFLYVLIKKTVPAADTQTYAKYFILSCCLYFCSTAVLVALPAARDFIMDFVKQTPEARYSAKDPNYVTRCGWAGFSGFEYTFKFVLGLIFNISLIEDELGEEKINITKFLPAVVLLAGTVCYGRVGTLFAVLLLVYVFVLLVRKKRKLFFWSFGIIAGVMVLLSVLQLFIPALHTWFNWALEPFIAFFKTGKLSVGSFYVLKENMLFMPDFKTVLVGDGRYTDGARYYQHTDSGLMRPLLFGGFIFALVRCLSLYVPLVADTMKKEDRKSERAVSLWVLLCCLFFELKGEIVFSCLPVMLILWLSRASAESGEQTLDLKRDALFICKKWWIAAAGTAAGCAVCAVPALICGTDAVVLKAACGAVCGLVAAVAVLFCLAEKEPLAEGIKQFRLSFAFLSRNKNLAG